MKRREFIALLGSAAAWPLEARAERATLPLIGYIGGAYADASVKRMQVMRDGLAETGFIVGRSVAIEYRWAEDQPDRIPALAADLVAQRAKIIIADSTLVANTVRAIAGQTPIVFLSGADPIKLGWVHSLNRPGTNLTGVFMLNTEATQKRAELLIEAIPQIKTVGFLGNTRNPNFPTHRREIEAAAQRYNFELRILAVVKEDEFDYAFHHISQLRPSGMVVQADPWLDARADQLINLASKYEVPAIYQWREQTEAGGLISFGVDLRGVYRTIGNLVGRILSGAAPEEVPVQQATKIELIVNSKTAKALHLRIADSIMIRADEIIE